ncbi:MAG TPA: hypothetical protein VNJ09_11455 [Chthonomonadales bacterium]|nr:hypothetical protein [Chthonomonadales bacterium]
MKKIVRSRMARLLMAVVVLGLALSFPVNRPKAQFNGGNSDCNISFIDRSQRRIADFFGAIGGIGSTAPVPNDAVVVNVGFNLSLLPQPSFPIGPPGGPPVLLPIFGALFGDNAIGGTDGCIDDIAGGSANAWIRWRTRCDSGGLLTVRELGFTPIAPNNSGCSPSSRWIIIYDSSSCGTVSGCPGATARTVGNQFAQRFVTGNSFSSTRHFIEVGVDNSSCSGIGTYEIIQCCDDYQYVPGGPIIPLPCNP